MTLDVDSVFQSTGNFTSYFKRWSERRAVLASVLVQNSLAKTITETITIRSCEIVGLSASKLTQPVPNLWWNDAPVYEKRGFDEFFSRINWTLVSDKIRPLTFGRYTCCEPAAFEHSWYLCYKALVEGWEQVRVTRMRSTCTPRTRDIEGSRPLGFTAQLQFLVVARFQPATSHRFPYGQAQKPPGSTPSGLQ